MNKSHNLLAEDLRALRYLDALTAGDLETVAALWEEASRDPDLERRLAELDGALFIEATAKKPAPSRQPRARRRRWPVAVALVGLAAACVLILVAWPKPDEPRPVTNVAKNDVQVAVRPPDETRSTGWQEHRRVLDGADMPAVGCRSASSMATRHFSASARRVR